MHETKDPGRANNASDAIHEGRGVREVGMAEDRWSKGGSGRSVMGVRIKGNSKGVEGDGGRDVSCRMWAQREPAGASGGGSAGGGSAGGGSSSWSSRGWRKMGAGVCVVAEGLRELSTGVRSLEGEACPHTSVNETEGTRVVGAGVDSPGGVVEAGGGVWSDPTRQEGPYPSHSRSREESSDVGQHSQSIA